MSPLGSLRNLISQKLSAAAEEIFSEFERTIQRYEQELDRQRKLLRVRAGPGEPAQHRTPSFSAGLQMRSRFRRGSAFIPRNIRPGSDASFTSTVKSDQVIIPESSGEKFVLVKKKVFVRFLPSNRMVTAAASAGSGYHGNGLTTSPLRMAALGGGRGTYTPVHAVTTPTEHDAPPFIEKQISSRFTCF